MPTIAYVSCANDKVIVAFEMDRDSGRLQEVARTFVPGSDAPSLSSLPLALSPDQRFLYAALRGRPYPLSTFAIDPRTGGLEHVGLSYLPNSMCYLSADPSGTRLFAASYDANMLSVSGIEGGIAGPCVQTVATPANAHCVRPAPDGPFVYAACLGGNVILAQNLQDGRLDPDPHEAATPREGAGPRHLEFAPGRLYCLNELDATLDIYARDASTGALTALQSVSAIPHPVSGNASAADLHLRPDGRFLYASVRSTNTLAAFQVRPESVSLIGHVPSEPTPRGFAVEPEGRFLLCAGLASGMVGTYAINPETGGLERVGAVTAGAGANWIEIIQLPG